MKHTIITSPAVLSLVLAVCPCPVHSGGEKAALTPAEKAGWTLHFHDRFNRDEPGNNWTVYQGNWSVKDGTLHGRGCLVSTKGFPDDSWGFTRLEFEVETAAHPENGAPHLGALIHARPQERRAGDPWQSGYCFQLGAGSNAVHRITRDGKEVAADTDPKTRIASGRVHQIVVENDQGKVRLFVDGTLILEYADRSPFFAGNDYNRAGFFFGAGAGVRNVKVYIKRMDDMDHFL